MKTADYITNAINRLPKGYVFTYADFINKVKNVGTKQKSPPAGKEAIIKTLNRMAAAGKIAKLAKGKFYKPENSAFGKLKPERYQIVKDLLEEDGKVIGYLTGYSIYNELGLTTQISNTIQIGKNNVRPMLSRNGYKITFIRQKNIITRDNIPLLQMLDTIRYIKKIPDTNTLSACKRLIAILKDISSKEKITLVRLALKYPPATRALLGALLCEAIPSSNKKEKTALTDPLYKSLNPISIYKIFNYNIPFVSFDFWNII